jgi:hypothetical protein
MKVSVDRVEGGIAILLMQDDPYGRIQMPASILPSGCREGDVLDLTLVPDPAAAAAAKERVSGLMERITKKR